VTAENEETTISGDPSSAGTPSIQRKALTSYRRRLKHRGVVRLQVHVHKSDAALVRAVPNSLADPERYDAARALLGALRIRRWPRP
jgi:hypothetical protein